MAKEPSQRPPDARALASELTLLGDMPEDAGSVELMATMVAHTPPESFAQSEQNLFCVVLAVPPAAAALAPVSVEDVERRQSLEIAMNSAGARGEWLLDGTLVVTLRSLQSALDQATLAARMALLVREHWPEAHVGVGTGRGTVQGFMPVGEAVERAARLLRTGMRAQGGELDPGRRLGVYVDDLSARLLERRFVLTVHAGCAFLTGEELSTDKTHPLLGKATPCVGREVELTTLLAILTGCVDESESMVALVTAPAGAGKSRLRHEFLRRVQAQQDSVTTLLGLGDMMSAGAPYGILGKALRRLCGLHGSEPFDAQRPRFAARIGQHLGSDDRRRVIAYLGELCGLSFPDAEHEKLRAARQEPRIMQEQISAAFVTWLEAECARAPVLLVLEDLHWGDPMTVSLLDGALQALKQKPLMVLALARPEVHQLLPGLWSRHVPKEFVLPPLGRKACERLIHQVLGAQLSAPIVARLCAQSEGNALFLEELIRAANTDKGEELPHTVLAMLQARLSRLPADARRVLRAASVFGEVFWQGGVVSLLHDSTTPGSIERWLSQLVDEETIAQVPQSSFPGETEYRFRHALIRDAAYSLLTEEDSRIGHLHAGRFLEQLGESDPMILIEHYRRGGALERTGLLYFQAGNDAFRLCALPKARELFEESYRALSQVPDCAALRRHRADVLLQQVHASVNSESSEQNLTRLTESRAIIEALMSSADAEPADRLRLAQVHNLFGLIYHYRSRPVEALEYFRKVLPVAEESGDESMLALPSLLIGTVLMAQGQPSQALPLLGRAFRLLDRFDNEYSRLRTMGLYAVTLIMSGRYAEGMKLHERAIEQAHKLEQPAGLAVVYFHKCCSLRVCGDFAALHQCVRHVLEHAGRSGEQIYLYTGLSMRSWAESYFGQHEAALASRAEARRIGEELGGRLIAADWFAAGDAEIALRAGHVEHAVQLAQSSAEQSRRLGQMLGLGLAEQTWGLALGHRVPADLQGAESHLQTALELMESCNQVLPAALLRLEWARLCRRCGDDARARVLYAEAAQQFEKSGCAHLLESYRDLLQDGG